MRYIISVIFVLCVGKLSAQEKNSISGKVINAVSSAPVPNASVFISNTSRGTISHVDGSFILSGITSGTYELVISSIGFTTVVYPFSGDKLPLQVKIILSPKATELDSVVVEPYVEEGWDKWGKFFTENFIGTSEVAQSCTIKNYTTIRFRF